MKDDPEFNIYFVSLIEENSCLYDYTSADYRNVHLQEKVWDKIANQVSETAHDCKERWKNLRGCYTRHLKHTSCPSNQTKIKKPYYLAEYLTFLKPFTKTRKSRSNFSTVSKALGLTSFPELIEGENRNDSDSDNEEIHQEYDNRPQSPSQSSYDDHCFIPPPPKQMKESAEVNTTGYDYFQINKGPTENKMSIENICQDPDFSFLISVLPDMKEMNNEQKRKFKIGILSLAGQILNDSRTSNLCTISNQNLSNSMLTYTIPKSET